MVDESDPEHLSLRDFVVIDLFDIVQSRFERDRDYAKLQGQGLDWFSRSGVRLRMYREPAGDLITSTKSSVLTNFVVNTCQNTYESLNKTLQSIPVFL